MSLSRPPNIPLNDLSRGTKRDKELLLAATAAVLDSGHLIHGPEHANFERELAEFVGVPYAMGVASGTDALEISMKAAMPPGRNTVLTGANAGGYSSTAARRAGFSLAYADVNTTTLCLDVDSVAAALSEEIGVVVFTHMYGNLTDVSALVQICRENGTVLLEDCAQSIGASRNGTMAGAFGDIAAFSFYPTKNLGGLGDGGAVVCSDPVIAERVKTLRQYGWKEKYNSVVPGGTNSRLDEVQAAFLRRRLPMLNAFNERRRWIVSRYVKASASVPEAVMTVLPAIGPSHVAHLAVARSSHRDAVRDQLLMSGIQTDVHFPVPDYRQDGFEMPRTEDLPATTLACAQVLSLPCFPEMTDEEVNQVCEAIAELR